MENHVHSHEDEMGWWKPAVSLVLLASGILMSAIGMPWFQDIRIQLVWYLAAFLPVGWGVVGEAIEHARYGDVFSEFMLMSIASVGAFLIGEFPEAVAVMVFYCIGEALQDKAVDHARDSIKSLVGFRPDTATVVGGDGSLMVVSPDDVAVGYEIEVRAGERVPLDGLLLGGEAAFNTAALTGESVPRLVENGAEVLAGMIAVDSTVRLRVIRPAAQSAISRILAMVEDATERKAPAELFIHRFAHIYTPTVMLAALLLTLVPTLCYLLAGESLSLALPWVYRSLLFLVISCPCALVISIPLSYFAGIGAASRRGVLFKGGNYLDAIAKVDTVVFDKTGTLTTGRFAVRHADGLDAETLAVVAAIEQSSTHPIAQAIAEYAVGQGAQMVKLSPSAVTNLPGRGLSADTDGVRWLAGTLRLLDEERVAYPQELCQQVQTIVAVARDGQYVGHILLADTLKDDARLAVESLAKQHIHTQILSGDKQRLVDDVARELGVDEGHGDLLPQDKVAQIDALRQSGRCMAFVGDGINDAPVLALSDVGIAMGALGSDMAVETADVVIQTDQPSRVGEAIAISRFTRNIVRQNIVFAIGTKLLIMLLGVLGWANLWAAVFADVGVALLAVLNATRIFWHSRGKTKE